MKLVLKILGVLAVVIVLLVITAFFLPREYRIERSIVIKARPDVVLTHVADLRAWKNWGAWQERDPAMELTYSTPATGVGSWSAWKSAKEGNGKMTITQLTPLRVDYGLEFPDDGMKSLGVFELIPQADDVRAVWSDTGDLGMNPIGRWFGLFLDKIIGPDFERGLSNLKKLAEK